MFEKLTDRAYKVITLARQEAQRFHHQFIGSEHILLGLIQEGTDVAAQVLETLGVDRRQLRAEVEKEISAGPSTVISGQFPYTPLAKRVLEFAQEEAQSLGHNFIGTEHLLLGLLHEGQGVAGKVLMNSGLRVENVREQILNHLCSPRSSATPLGTKDRPVKRPKNQET